MIIIIIVIIIILMMVIMTIIMVLITIVILKVTAIKMTIIITIITSTDGTTKKPRVCVHNSESPQEREFGLEISCHAHYLILSNSRVSLRHEVCSYHTKPHSSLFVLSIISEYFMLVIIIIIIIIIIFIDRYDRYH